MFVVESGRVLEFGWDKGEILRRECGRAGS